MPKPARLGNVNAYVRSSAWLGRREFEFDGTTKGLTIAAYHAGAKPGALIDANFGGRSRAGARAYKFVAAPYDDRAKGYWVTSASGWI